MTHNYEPEAPHIAQLQSDININSEVQPLADLGHRERFKYVLGGVAEDYHESSHPIRTIGSGIMALGTQVLDRARLSVVLVPEVAVDVFKHTHSSPETGAAAAAVFFAWCAGVGEALGQGLNQYPATVNRFDQSYPGFAQFFADSLPGFEKPVANENTSLPRRIGSAALTRVRRGLTTIGIGTTAYVGTAVTKGQNQEEARKLYGNASLDGAVVLGGVVMGLSEVIIQIGTKHPELALRIQNDASNSKVWYGVAVALMAGEFITNKFKRHSDKLTAKAGALPSIDHVEEGI